MASAGGGVMAGFNDAFQQLQRDLTRRELAQREAMLRPMLQSWLPRGLKWMVHRPRLVRWYLKLPHRTRIVGVQIGPMFFYTVERRRA